MVSFILYVGVMPSISNGQQPQYNNFPMYTTSGTIQLNKPNYKVLQKI